jgi:hypothetical protein
MDIRQIADQRSVHCTNRQFLETACSYFRYEKIHIGIQLAQPHFNRCLPYACAADENIIGVGNQLARVL